MSGSSVPRHAIEAATFLLAMWVVVHGVGVVGACSPAVPLYDHAILMADMLHTPPHLFRGHNEHLPVIPRLVFWLEAHLTSGDPRLPVTVGIHALLAAALVVTRAWTSRPRLLCGTVLFAALMRPSLAWSVSWATNIQYPLALLGAAVAFWAAHHGRLGLAVLAGAWAGASSAEGLLVLPLIGSIFLRRGRRLESAVIVACCGVLVYFVAAGGSSALRLPSGGEEVALLARFAGELVAYPWSLRLWGVLIGPLLLVAASWRLRSGRAVDGPLIMLAVYGLGFATLVVIGRWWLGSVHHRYALGATVAVAAGIASLVGPPPAARSVRAGAIPSDRWRTRLQLVFMMVLAVEATWLARPIAEACRSEAPAGTAFWRGESDDGRDAHPGFPAEIAVELRAHLWRAGLYQPTDGFRSKPSP